MEKYIDALLCLSAWFILLGGLAIITMICDRIAIIRRKRKFDRIDFLREHPDYKEVKGKIVKR